jgi:hypothetical protein
MKDIKLEILHYEEKFEKLKTKNEKLIMIYVIIYFFSVIGLVYFQQKFFSEDFIIKIILFSVILFGLIVYYFLRYFFMKSKKRNKYFFNMLINDLKSEIEDNKNFGNIILTSAREIFDSRDTAMSDYEIKKSPFWELLFFNLKIEIK